MKNFSKYLLLLFLIENLCTQTTMLEVYTTPIFYAFLVVGSLLAIQPRSWSSVSFERFGWIFGLSAVYAFHCFVVGLEFLNQENIIFLVSKVATFFIIMYSLNSDFEFYEKRAGYLFSLIAGLFLVYGLVFARGDIAFNGIERSAFGFVNSNSMGGVATIVFGILLCEYKDKKWGKLQFTLCGIALFSGLASGSRASIVVIALIYLSQYKLSAKSFAIIAMLAVIALFVLPNMGVQITGINRMKETITGELGNNRGDEREAAYMMIEDKPLTGWGLKTENQGRAAQITMMSSHNSYLDLAKTMGIPLAIVWTLIVSTVLLEYLRAYRKRQVPLDFYAVFAFCTLFKGAFEAMFAGVHNMETNFFYVSLAILSMRLYNNSHNLCK